MSEVEREGSPKPAATVVGREVRSLPKRFYKAVTLDESRGRWQVLLDGRAAKTPRKLPLACAIKSVSTAVADEWAGQTDVIDPATMPVTRLLCTAIDAVTGSEALVAAEIAAYANSDLLCYRATGPEALVRRQAAAWDPVLAWLARDHGLRLNVVAGLMPTTQPADNAPRIVAMLDALPAERLAALHVLTTISGSAVLALALLHRHLTLDAMWAAANIDEDHQAEQWGWDAEAEARRKFRLRDMQAAALVLSAK